MKTARVAWFTALDRDGFSKSRYFTDTVLPLMQDRFEIELFSDTFESQPPSTHYLAAFDRHSKKRFDLFFYQVENGKRFHFLRGALGLCPGITLFHDYYLTDLGPDPLTNSPWEVVCARLNDEKVSWPNRKVEFPRKGPEAMREAGLTRVPIFSSPRTRGDFQRANPKRGAAWYLPTPIAPFQTKIAPKELVLGFCGSPNIEHRAHKVFEALHGLQSPVKLIWLVDEAEETKAQEILAEFRLNDTTILKGRTPERWKEVLSDVSAAVHTQYSIFGSMEPWLGLSLMAERPCIVTDFADAAFLPEEAVFKIAPGESEATQIRLVLEQLSKNPAQKNSCGRAYAEENLAAGVVADELGIIFERSLHGMQHVVRQWRELMREARTELYQEQVQALSGWNSKELAEVYAELGWR